MPTAEPSLIHTALELSGTLLYAVTAMIIVFGLLVVGISLRGPQKN
jgi:hypothetical protein